MRQCSLLAPRGSLGGGNFDSRTFAVKPARTTPIPFRHRRWIDASNRARGLGELISQSQNAKETLLISNLPGPMRCKGAALADKLALVPTFDNWPPPLG